MSKIENFKMFIDGEWVESSSGKKIETLNPETNEVCCAVSAELREFLRDKKIPLGPLPRPISPFSFTGTEQLV